MYRVLVHHRNEYGEEPEVVVDVPGVMTILGSYSDYCDGYALMCTNTQGLRLAISRRTDNTVKVYNHTIQDRKKFQLSGLKCKSDDKWISTVKAVFIALQHDGITLPGMDISITGRTAHSDYDTLSAAVAAGFLIAFNDLLDLSLSLNDMLRIAHAANSYSNGSSRLRDLLTLFIIKKKELVLFDLETYSYERLLSIDPDYIIIAVSSYYQQGDAGYALGYGVTSTEAAQQVVEEYKSRPGWSNLTAVQNDSIILYYPELGFTPAAFEKVLYLAEFLYPEYCGDLDADAIMDEYFDRFLPFDVTGLWYYKAA